MYKNAFFINLIAVIFFQMLFVKVVFAWGAEGHQTVAQIAQIKISSKAKNEIDKLLLLEPGSSLVSIST